MEKEEAKLFETQVTQDERKQQITTLKAQLKRVGVDQTAITAISIG
jgi:hypothetical protein